MIIEFKSPKLGTEVFFMKSNKVSVGTLLGVSLSRVIGGGIELYKGNITNNNVFYVKGISGGISELSTAPFESKVELLNSL